MFIINDKHVFLFSVTCFIFCTNLVIVKVLLVQIMTRCCSLLFKIYTTLQKIQRAASALVVKLEHRPVSCKVDAIRDEPICVDKGILYFTI